MPPKVVIQGNVEKKSNKKYKIKAHKGTEVDADIDILEDGDFQVDKLSVDGLPATMYDGKAIRWLNNFAIKKGNAYINQPYKVTIPGLVQGKVVILDNNSVNGQPYYFTGSVTNNTIQLSDGDPAVGVTT